MYMLQLYIMIKKKLFTVKADEVGSRLSTRDAPFPHPCACNRGLRLNANAREKTSAVPCREKKKKKR